MVRKKKRPLFNYDGVKAGWNRSIYIMSDLHIDNPMCRRDLLTRHLSQAKESDSPVLIFGDLFCAMQGKFDPRSSMDDIRPEDVGVDYLDRIVDNAARVLAPFADTIQFMSLGNHETNILRRHGINLINMLDLRLGRVSRLGGYTGYISFRFKAHKTVSKTVNLKFHHGGGSGGGVTKGVTTSNRMATYLPDAQIVVTGHSHDHWVLPLARERLTIAGRVYRDLQWHIRTPGYKDEYIGRDKGFHHERLREPKPLGCVRVDFNYHPDNTISVDAVGLIE